MYVVYEFLYPQYVQISLSLLKKRKCFSNLFELFIVFHSLYILLIDLYIALALPVGFIWESKPKKEAIEISLLFLQCYDPL